MKPDIPEAVSAIDSVTNFSTLNGKIVDWDISIPKTNNPQPTEEAIQTELDRLLIEWTAQEYARNRASEYPSLLELTVALYDTDDKSAIEAKRAAVKAKYPKP